MQALYVGAGLATVSSDATLASEMLDEAMELGRAQCQQAGLAYVYQGRALLAMYQDDIEEAMALFERSLSHFTATGDSSGTAFTNFLYTLASSLSRDSNRVAATHARGELTAAKRESWTWSCSLWAAGLDAWLRGETTRAVELQHLALQIKRPLEDQLGGGECLEALAWISAGEGHKERAAVLLGAADAIWARIGITLRTLPGLGRYRTECERIVGLGSDPRYAAAYRLGERMTFDESIDFALSALDRPPGRERGSRACGVTLTKREQEVAELLGDGLTNQDIALRLFLSRRTVEVHVQHILAKLGFSSRFQVVAWMTERRQGANANSQG
jgi:DNA-binding CsgD family transcriptional regulator